jgi:hypothetical protein
MLTYRVRRGGTVFVLLVAGMLSIAVSGALAAGWLTPENVPLSVSDLGFDAQGNAIAVGVGADSGEHATILAMTRPFGGQWSDSVPVSGSDDSEVYRPQIAVNPHGDAVAVWSAYNDTALRYVVEVSNRPAGGEWSDPVVVSENEVYDRDQEVAIDAQGNATVIWADIPPIPDVGFVVRSASRPSGGDWSEPVELSGGTLRSSPRLAVDEQGNVTAVWLGSAPASGGGFVDVVRSKSRPFGGTWSSDAVDLSSDDGTAQAPRIVVDPQGNAVAVWLWHGSAGYVVQAARRVAGGDWSAADDLGSGSGNDGYSPQVAVDAQGNATAIWSSPAASGSVVRSRSSTVGGPWSSSINLATSNDDDTVGYPWVAADPQGNVTAIWARYTSSDVIAQATRRVTGSANWSTAIDLTVGRPITAIPAAGIDPQGHASMVWSSSEEPWSGFSTVFDPVAPELRNVTAPAIAIVGQPVDLSVNPFDDWSTVTTSWNFGDGETASGTAVHHTYASPGQRTVTITGVDATGNTTQTSQTITVEPVPAPAEPGPDPTPGPVPAPGPGPAPAPGPAPGPILKAPVVSGLEQSGARWRTHKVKRGPRLPVGTTFQLKLDRAAQLRFAFSQIGSGRKVNGRCVKTTKANRRKPRCDRDLAVGTLNVTGRTGTNSFAFRGTIRGQTLKPGRYRLLVTALADGKTSTAAPLRFTIAG